jgi:purine-cytosine permease-like protein
VRLRILRKVSLRGLKLSVKITVKRGQKDEEEKIMFEFADLFSSPFIVPVGAFAMVAIIVGFNTWHRIEVRRMQREERLAAIARGLPLPPEPAPAVAMGEAMRDAFQSEFDPWRRAQKTRSTAIILIAVGLGIIAGMMLIAHVVGAREVLAGAIGGIIPMFIGFGFVVDYMMQRSDLERQAAAAANRPPRQ